MLITLNVPEDFDVQFVYRMSRDKAYQTALAAGYAFVFLSSPLDGVRYFRPIIARYGLSGFVKTLLKLATGRRKFYAAIQHGSFASLGWCTRGSCRYYRVDQDDVVIGPIETGESHQGKGLGTTAMMLAINRHIEAGSHVFYIDTQRINVAARRTFEKCGFGDPIALYRR